MINRFVNIVWVYWKNAVLTNDKCLLIADRLKRFLQITTAKRHSWETKQQKIGWIVLGRVHTEINEISRRTNKRQGRIDDDKIPGLERSVSYRADPALLSTHKLKSENVTHEVNHEYSRKRQNGDLRRFWGAQRSHCWGSPRGWLIWFKYREVRVYRGFFPGKNCELLFVRGTISFYNHKLKILPS